MIQSPTMEQSPENEPSSDDTTECEQLERLLRGYIDSKRAQQPREPRTSSSASFILATM